MKKKIKELLDSANAIRGMFPESAKILEEEAKKLETQQQEKIQQKKERIIKREYDKKVITLFENSLENAKKLIGTLGAINDWWKDKNISLADKLLMKLLSEEPDWLKEWNGFKKGKNTIMPIPLLIVPGESQVGGCYNLVIQSNNEAPQGYMSQENDVLWENDDRDVVKSLETHGLGGSVLIFIVGNKPELCGKDDQELDNILITGQVDMVVVNNSRCIYDNNMMRHIIEITEKNGVKKPLLICPGKIIPDFHHDWFEGYAYLFHEQKK